MQQMPFKGIENLISTYSILITIKLPEYIANHSYTCHNLGKFVVKSCKKKQF